MSSATRSRRVVLAAMILLLGGVVFLCGCTGTSGDDAGTMDITVITTSPTEQPTQEPTVGEEWIVWREGSNTLNPLGDYFAYTPNVNGKEFRSLKVEVRSEYPVTVLFLNHRELTNFETKMATNSGKLQS